MMWTNILLITAGLSSGLLVSGGIFAVLAAVSMVPRFAGKTHTAKITVLYEQMIVAGTIIGSFFTVFEPYLSRVFYGHVQSQGGMGLWTILIVIYGLFAGIFVGALAIGIAEMLDAIPIFARRISLRHGLGIILLAWAAGKLSGSLIFFVREFY